ncbi:hypothetical protein MPTK1_6g16220 [Marchantia polymorpha subsp. ruderalis]|uniref:Uncharacterized protein n=2 Tax=Marchantia polymorpha TaxID=3197 RepID=A0AAF6BSM1_MARPO|nr:hypothetical protein MARPO_0056s0132 [Marchantia polymorpha]BBN15005.1 hypothetical protein Mp_6g16220 [Marchantia polymorpha subsp. ruderalis]|eukprot:PTQ37689.1 hypothetical protein MARPO_0056s0132 [Marchantia polymorpha]
MWSQPLNRSSLIAIRPRPFLLSNCMCAFFVIYPRFHTSMIPLRCPSFRVGRFLILILSTGAGSNFAGGSRLESPQLGHDDIIHDAYVDSGFS